MLTCPECGNQYPVKNGHIHNGKQRFLGRSCGRQFAENPENKNFQNNQSLVD